MCWYNEKVILKKYEKSKLFRKNISCRIFCYVASKTGDAIFLKWKVTSRKKLWGWENSWFFTVTQCILRLENCLMLLPKARRTTTEIWYFLIVEGLLKESYFAGNINNLCFCRVIGSMPHVSGSTFQIAGGWLWRSLRNSSRNSSLLPTRHSSGYSSKRLLDTSLLF